MSARAIRARGRPPTQRSRPKRALPSQPQWADQTSMLLLVLLQAHGDTSGARPLSQALLEQQLLLQEHPHVDYMLRTPEAEDADKGIVMQAKGARMLFKIAFDAATEDPNPDSRNQAVRTMFDLLALGASRIDIDPEEYRKQLTAEHGVDPLSVPHGADFVTEEAFHAATMDPRFASVQMQDLFAGFAGGAEHEEL